MSLVLLAGVALLFARGGSEAERRSIAWPREEQAVCRWVV
jgi:hypothetical protein